MKHLTAKYELLFAFVLLTLSSIAQKDSSGIYKTVTDYQQGKLSYAINYKTQSHKINDNLLFNESEIKVKHDGKSYTLKKSETFGYRDMKGVDFRFAENKAYRILSCGEGLCLYVYNASKSNKGSVQYVAVYYFSKDEGSGLQLLTRENVKAAFPDNHKFHDAVDAMFKDDNELASYDSFHKMYKLNHVLAVNK